MVTKAFLLFSKKQVVVLKSTNKEAAGLIRVELLLLLSVSQRIIAHL